MGAQRNVITAVLDGELYQRGQILSWKRAQKEALLLEYDIDIVVNFWPKLDPDMSDLPCWYWYMPSESIEMMDEKMWRMARTLSTLIQKDKCTALILCEAGKTRSVFFTCLVLYQICPQQAAQIIRNVFPGHRMKPYMVEHLEVLNLRYGAK